MAYNVVVTSAFGSNAKGDFIQSQEIIVPILSDDRFFSVVKVAIPPSGSILNDVNFTLDPCSGGYFVDGGNQVETFSQTLTIYSTPEQTHGTINYLDFVFVFTAIVDPTPINIILRDVESVYGSATGPGTYTVRVTLGTPLAPGDSYYAYMHLDGVDPLTGNSWRLQAIFAG